MRLSLRRLYGVFGYPRCRFSRKSSKFFNILAAWSRTLLRRNGPLPRRDDPRSGDLTSGAEGKQNLRQSSTYCNPETGMSSTKQALHRRGKRVINRRRRWLRDRIEYIGSHARIPRAGGDEDPQPRHVLRIGKA